jgi:hypothetical protein
LLSISAFLEASTSKPMSTSFFRVGCI